MKRTFTTLLAVCFLLQISLSQNATITGNIWIEEDSNNMYNGEQVPTGVLVYLIDFDTDEIIDSTMTAMKEYQFPSSANITIDPGNYYLEIPISEFQDGVLTAVSPCPGFNDANDGIDNDDNGMDGIPAQTTVFMVGNEDVTHVDFCYFFDCNEANALAATSCDQILDIDIFCDISILGTFCNLMPTGNSTGNQPLPLCPSSTGGAHNISWFAFVAYDGNYEVTVTPSNCIGSATGDEGIQIGLYTDCSFSESVFCNADCNTSPVTFSSDLLIPGQVYYFFIDGCSGSVCSYEVSVSGSPIPPTTEVEEVCIIENGNTICEDKEYCVSADVVFQTDYVNSNATYTWTVTTISGGPYTGDPSPVTEDNSLGLSFETVGIYSVCIENIARPCSGFDWMGLECRTVTIKGVVNEVFDTTDVCSDLLVDFYASNLSDQDPNGDGIFGWLDTSYVFSFGNNVSVSVDSNLCSIQQEIFLTEIENPEIGLGIDTSLLCLGDTLNVSFSTNVNEDSIIWTVNDMQQSYNDGFLFSEFGDFVIEATVDNVCGSSSDIASIQVLDTISVPKVTCDTLTAGMITLLWPNIDDADGYSLSINEEAEIIVTDSFYVIENLESGEVVNVIFDLLDSIKCVGPSKVFACKAPIITGLEGLDIQDVKIIPNPCSDFIFIDGGLEAMNAAFEIYSINGELISSGMLSTNQRIDVMNLKAGLYVVKVSGLGGKKKKIGRFVKYEW